MIDCGEIVALDALMLRMENAGMASYLFMLSALLIVLWIYNKMDDPIAFFFCGAGVIVCSFFVKRGINQVTGS